MPRAAPLPASPERKSFPPVLSLPPSAEAETCQSVARRRVGDEACKLLSIEEWFEPCHSRRGELDGDWGGEGSPSVLRVEASGAMGRYKLLTSFVPGHSFVE
eukprot:3936534-Rhodomonas_salina.1